MTRRAFALLLVLPVAVAGWWLDDDDIAGTGEVRGDDRGRALTVLTYNVCFERPDPATAEAIAALDADLVFLQETNAAHAALLEERLAERYPVRLFHEHVPDGGMAVLSRYPVLDEEVRPSPARAFPAWCLRLETPDGPIDVLSVHLHPPLHDDRLVAGYFMTGDVRLREFFAHLGCFDRP
ncbi:MAG: endonuclease/exonuclease/phosphatase family protein, partial [Polyangiaceae bacterium]